MGTFHTSCKIEDLGRRQAVELARLLVDSGSEHTWVDAASLESIGIRREKKDVTFVMANGQRITRAVGYGILHAGGTETVDELVFAEEGDLQLLGARTLEGLNLCIDPLRKKLVAAGPIPAASAA